MTQDRPVVVVTGASGNVGRALLRLLLSREVRVVALDRDPARALSEFAAVGAPQADCLAAGVGDLAEPAASAAAVAAALARFGRIDGLAHTVGGFAMGRASLETSASFERMFRLNVLTALHTFAAVLPTMRARRRGALVAIGAGAAMRGGKEMAAYAGSKSALLRLVESLAVEERAGGIRVNAVLPSIIDTPQNRAAMPNADVAAWARPEEVAEAIAFLLSDRASGVTGASLPVPGRV